MFWGSVKGTGYPLHSPVSPSRPHPCVSVCHHISTGVYRTSWTPKNSLPCSQAALHRTLTRATYISLHLHSKILEINIHITQPPTHMLSKSFLFGFIYKEVDNYFSFGSRIFPFRIDGFEGEITQTWVNNGIHDQPTNQPNLTFRWPCGIVINSYNKTNQTH